MSAIIERMTMSRSKPRTTNPNPASKFISLSGKTGKFNYWDKEQKEVIEIEYPIVFLPLDVLSSIKGFSQKEKSGIYSNEVHNLAKEVLTVKIFDKGEIAEGLYKAIKDAVKTQGGKFCRSVYAMMYFDSGENTEKIPEIVNFQLVGASLGAWIEFENEHSIYDGAVKITGVKPAKTGATEYFIPEFSTNTVSKESAAVAFDLDKQLQKYLDEYKSNQTSSKDTTEEETKSIVREGMGNDDYDNSYDDSIPF